MTEKITIDRAELDRALQLCEWISETPHQRGSINGLAAQVLHSISAALAAPQPADVPTENLIPVIQWLEAGCDPKDAATELRLLSKAVPQPAQGPECERCGEAPGMHTSTYWCDNQSFTTPDGRTQLGCTTPQAPQRQPLFGELIAQHPGLSEELAEIDRAVEAKHGCAALAAPQPAQEPIGTVVSYHTDDCHTKWAFQPEAGAWEIPQDPQARDRGARSCFTVYTAPQAPQPLTNCRHCGGPGDVICAGQCKRAAIGITKGPEA